MVQSLYSRETGCTYLTAMPYRVYARQLIFIQHISVGLFAVMLVAGF
jgi:hypothetical protein